MNVIVDKAKEDSVVALLECGWKAKIVKDECNAYYSAYRNDKQMAFIDIICFDADPEYETSVPIKFKAWNGYLIDLLMAGQVIVAVLLGTEVRFIEVKNIPFDIKDVQMVDDELCLMVHASNFKFVGKVVPRSETEYAGPDYGKAGVLGASV